MRNQTLMSRQLEYFSVVFRKRSISAAAKAIPISYQGLKKSLSKLEAEVGAALFTVSGEDGELTPTRDAELLYELMLRWTEDVNRLGDDLARGTKGDVRVIDVCAAGGCIGTVGPSPIFRFEDEHPGIRLNLTEHPDDLADGSLLSGEYGIGFTASPFDENLITEPIASAGCAAWVNRSHPLAQKTSLRLEDLEGESVILPDRRYKANHFMQSALREKGIRLKQVRECANPTWSMAFAIEDEAPGDAILLPVEDGYVYTMGLSRRRGHILTPDERLVWDWFLQYRDVIR